jgi:single-stranded-DNA-specific exonuclease
MLLSLNNHRWIFAPQKIEIVKKLQNEHSLSPLVATCLAERIKEIPAKDWLYPSMEHLHDPMLMLGMDKAIDRVLQAIRNKDRIRIVTDYDVDGTTSSLVLQAVCRLLGSENKIDYHIPDRFTEGYGFSEGVAHKAIQDGIQLILTADIGIRDHLSVQIARNAGVDVIICDHHLPPGESVPKDANAVLCPPQEGCNYPNPALAACGVSLKLAQALLDYSPKYKSRKQELLRSMMKIVAIGTIADVVSLATLENRSIVSIGLQELRCPTHRHKPGLQALLDVSGIEDNWVTSYHVGYQIAPRINAAGRMHLASSVVELFQSNDMQKARVLARLLDDHNRDRQDVQKKMLELAHSQIPNPLPHFIVVQGQENEGWHRGVVGIVAGRLRDSHHRPTAVISVTNDSGRGSIRSTANVHAVQALEYCSDLLRKFGGHPVAAGFDVDPKNISALIGRLNEYVRCKLNNDDLTPERRFQAKCSATDIDLKLANEIATLGPFGKDNPEPLVWITEASMERPTVMKNGHLRFQVGRNKVIWWKGAKYLDSLKQGPFDLAARIGINRWKGRTSVQLTAEDILRTK